MKKILASASLAAVGAVTLNAANAPLLSPMETGKPWSISAGLRGFYDDNYAMRPKGVARESFGFEVSPSAKVNIFKEQTRFTLGYDYIMRYFEDRVNDTADHSHIVNGAVNHRFSEHHKLDVSDTFVVAREPELLEPSGITTAPLLRSDSNNVNNRGSLAYTAEWTSLISTVVGYSNSLYDYEQSGDGTYSAILDRMQHAITANLRFHVRPSTIASIGYQYGVVDYHSKDSLAFGGPYISPDVRDNNSHYVFVGVDHYFNPQLNFSGRAGVQLTEYTSRMAGSTKDETSPYADGSIGWTYLPGSTLQVGVRHERVPTDIALFNPGLPTLDMESTAAYAMVRHQITAKLRAGGTVQYQHSTFNGGAADGRADDYWTLGATLAYQINQFISAEVGYAYDNLDSDLAARGFDRNRIFLGVRVTY